MKITLAKFKRNVTKFKLVKLQVACKLNSQCVISRDAYWVILMEFNHLTKIVSGLPGRTWNIQLEVDFFGGRVNEMQVQVWSHFIFLGVFTASFQHQIIVRRTN